MLAKHGIPMDKTYFVIWTTTTWTLPANEAICLNGQFEYSFVKIGDEFHIMATELVKSVMDACHIENYEIVGEPVPGTEFELMRYNHVYLPRRAGLFWAITSRWKAVPAVSIPQAATAWTTSTSARSIRRCPSPSPWTMAAI